MDAGRRTEREAKELVVEYVARKNRKTVLVRSRVTNLVYFASRNAVRCSRFSRCRDHSRASARVHGRIRSQLPYGEFHGELDAILGLEPETTSTEHGSNFRPRIFPGLGSFREHLFCSGTRERFIVPGIRCTDYATLTTGSRTKTFDSRGGRAPRGKDEREIHRSSFFAIRVLVDARERSV